MKATVSIVMSTKNREKLLRRAIGSIRSQSFRSWGLTVIDDNSVDGTWGFLKELEKLDNRIRIVQNILGRNFSWVKQGYMLGSNSDYVCILDDDDFWEPEYLEKSVLYSKVVPGTLMTYTNCYLVNERGEVRLEDTSKGFPFPDVLPSLCVFNTLTFKKLGGWDLNFFNQKGKIIHAEIDGYLKVKSLGCVTHIPKSLVWIYRTTNSMGSSRSLSAYGNLKVMERWGKELRKEPKYWSTFNCRVGINLEEAHMKGSQKFFLEAIKSKPLMLIAWVALAASLLGHGFFVLAFKWYRRLVKFDGRVIGKVKIDKDGLWR